MSLIKKPSEIQCSETFAVLIYGQPGAGKTTLACSAPGAVLFDFDNGVKRVGASHRVPTVQMTSWEEALAAVDEVLADPDYHTIVIDTAGKMVASLEEHVARESSSFADKHGGLTLKGYSERKRQFVAFNKKIINCGRNVVYVAHEKETQEGDRRIIRPDVSGSAGNELYKELDLVGYVSMIDNRRTICFDPTERFYGKNTCELYGYQPIPLLTDASVKNDYMCHVLAACVARLRRNYEDAKNYEVLMADVEERINAIDSPQAATEFVAWIQTQPVIFQSLAVAREKLAAKVAEKGYHYNASTKEYEA